jgi:hypothetical protein
MVVSQVSPGSTYARKLKRVSRYRNFRACRLLAIRIVLELQAKGDDEWRVLDESLLLTAASVWLINSLHSRPDDGPSSRELMKAVLPITDDDDEDDLWLAHAPRNGQGGNGEDESDEDEFHTGTPWYPYGAIFLRRIISGANIPVPRMRRGGPFLSTAAFQYWFKASQEEIRHKYFRVGILPRKQPGNVRRPSTKAKFTPTYRTGSGSPEPVAFHLAERGLRLPSPPVDDGSDNEGPARHTNGTGDIDEEVTHIWRQFLVDVIIKSPNPKRAGRDSYCRLTHDERLLVHEALYENRNLSEVWNACQWRVAGLDEWRRAFNNMFPPAGHETNARVQNYLQCQYYLKWKETCARADPQTSEAIRRAIKEKVFSLNWIPDAAQDKMWQTKEAVNGRFTRFPPDTKGPAPRVIFRKRPRWDDRLE